MSMINISIEDINKCITHIINLRIEYEEYRSLEYKCNNFFEATYKETDTLESIERFYELLVDWINVYINYPTKKFLFKDVTKKAYLRKDDCFKFKLVGIPFIDKQEYYCVVNLFKNNRNILEVYTDEYCFIIRDPIQKDEVNVNRKFLEEILSELNRINGLSIFNRYSDGVYEGAHYFQVDKDDVVKLDYEDLIREIEGTYLKK